MPPVNYFQILFPHICHNHPYTSLMMLQIRRHLNLVPSILPLENQHQCLQQVKELQVQLLPLRYVKCNYLQHPQHTIGVRSYHHAPQLDAMLKVPFWAWSQMQVRTLYYQEKYCTVWLWRKAWQNYISSLGHVLSHFAQPLWNTSSPHQNLSTYCTYGCQMQLLNHFPGAATSIIHFVN